MPISSAKLGGGKRKLKIAEGPPIHIYLGIKIKIHFLKKVGAGRNRVGRSGKAYCLPDTSHGRDGH